jgi:all-trans-retinol dehydrogenase (NAD+)
MNFILEVLVMLFNYHVGLFVAMYQFFVPPPEKNVKNELVLITGAGSGLGRIMCEEFARRGAIVVACDINNQGNEETAEMVRDQGGTIHTYTCDVSSREKIYELADRVKKDLGNVTILVNNAGIVSGKSFLEIPDHMIQKTVDVCLMSHLWACKAFLPAMVESNHGHIVNIASIAGIVGTNKMTDYCAAKFGDVGFTESLEYELRASDKHGVKTTTVCPYFINTGMFEGCKTRFPALFPVLDPHETVQRIMQAILTEQTIVYIPRIMYWAAVAKSMLPVRATLVLHKFSGALSLMDTFRGRYGNK